MPYKFKNLIFIWSEQITKCLSHLAALVGSYLDPTRCGPLGFQVFIIYVWMKYISKLMINIYENILIW